MLTAISVNNKVMIMNLAITTISETNFAIQQSKSPICSPWKSRACNKLNNVKRNPDSGADNSNKLFAKTQKS